jgi:hypothetical protein
VAEFSLPPPGTSSIAGGKRDARLSIAGGKRDARDARVNSPLLLEAPKKYQADVN